MVRAFVPPNSAVAVLSLLIITAFACCLSDITRCRHRYFRAQHLSNRDCSVKIYKVAQTLEGQESSSWGLWLSLSL